jgi:SAM-dependent methyltransferase
VAKRTGKTHENLENELTPPPAPHRPGAAEPPRTRSSVGRQARPDRSGPIAISGGDFATPTVRKRTTTQPRGIPVLGATVPPRNGTPAPVVRDGAQPESPFLAPAAGDLGDAASQLAAEAAAVRALDSGPLTPPPLLDDPGPTPPPLTSSAAPSPIASESVAAGEQQSGAPEAVESAVPVPELELDDAHASAPVEAQPASGGHGAEPSVDGVAPVDIALTPAPEAFQPIDAAPPEAVTPPTNVESQAPLQNVVDSFAGDGELDVATHEDRLVAQDTPWPELSTSAEPATRARTPVPGAVPTDSMGGDGDAARREGDGAIAESRHSDEAAPLAADDDVAGGDELELDDATDGAETLDPLPAEALSEAGPTPESGAEAASLAPPPRPAAAPPPIPVGSPRRKTGELRAPEVPTAQVVASIVPEIPQGAATLPEALAQRPRRPKRSKPWFEEVFDEDYLRTLPFMSADQTLREVEFIEASLGVKPGGQVLDVGCGYGRHAIELVQRGLDVTGLDLSLPLLLRAADEAQRRAMSVNFVHADMREMAFDKQFDGAYCMLTSFGYFDEETNLRVAEGIARALKPGGRLLLDLVNRDYIVADLPSRVWWEGNGCVVLEEVDFNFHTSRILTHRSIVFEDGRQIEQEISIRAYSLHEIGRLLRQAGFRVIDISGSLATRGHFFGGTSRSLLILAEKRTDET